MKRPLARAKWTLLLVGLAAAGLACAAVAVLTRGASGPGLVLKIRADKTRYLVDEPLFVTVALKNTTRHDKNILRLYPPGGGILRFEITPPGEPTHKYRGGLSVDFGQSDWAKLWPLRLGPGDEHALTVNLTSESWGAERRTVLGEPGKYAIQARYVARDGRAWEAMDLRSDEFRVAVEEPRGADKDAHDVLLQCDFGRGAWGHAIEQKACYERILRRFPDCRYAPYVRYCLAGAPAADGFLQHRYGLRGTPEGAAAIRRAADMFFQVAEEASDTALGVDAREFAARDYACVGDVARALAQFEEAFVSPAATDEDRAGILGQIGRLKSGSFPTYAGFKRSVPRTPILLPLGRFAQAMGLSVTWDRAANTVKVSGPAIECVLHPGRPVMVINGVERTGVTVSLNHGAIEVSPSVIALLMAEQRGQAMANWLEPMLPD